MSDLWATVLEYAIIGIIYLVIYALIGLFLVYAERKVCAFIQVRLGPNRVGPKGFFQTIADFIKLLLKENIKIKNADGVLFNLAPFIVIVASFLTFGTVPFAKGLQGIDLNIGVFFIMAVSSMGVVGILLGGWSSNSKYSLIGAMRSGAQIVSYELSVGLSLVTMVILTGTMQLSQIIELQSDGWFIFKGHIPALISLIIMMIAGTAEINRGPFDLAEAESELTAGYHTEYSGFRWGIYMLSEYLNMFVLGGVVITLFWGGWLRPFPSMGWLEIPVNYGIPIAVFAGTGLWCFPASRKLPSAVHRGGLVIVGLCLLATAALFAIPAVNASLVAPFWFFLKLSIVLYVMIWVRGTFPRYRYDQLMDIGWKWMIPLGLAAILVNALVGVARG